MYVKPRCLFCENYGPALLVMDLCIRTCTSIFLVAWYSVSGQPWRTYFISAGRCSGYQIALRFLSDSQILKINTYFTLLFFFFKSIFLEVRQACNAIFWPGHDERTFREKFGFSAEAILISASAVLPPCDLFKPTDTKIFNRRLRSSPGKQRQTCGVCVILSLQCW